MGGRRGLMVAMRLNMRLHGLHRLSKLTRYLRRDAKTWRLRC
jgi:hypothetical protein